VLRFVTQILICRLLRIKAIQSPDKSVPYAHLQLDPNVQKVSRNTEISQAQNMLEYNRSNGQGSNFQTRQVKTRNHRAGFSVVELAVVTIIVLIVCATAIPPMITAMRNAHLRGAASDLGGIYEQARVYAIRDNRYYSTYILAASGSLPQLAYVDMLPKSTSGASGNGGTSVASGDPEVTMSSEVVLKDVGSAPNSVNLKSQLLPSTTPVTPTDTSVTAATFGPRGLPCTTVTATGGSICNSAGGPTAYWTFLQNTKSGTWQAVTITPAGRIQKWFYDGSSWEKL
jgi:Tfp pilus assembly protein FimT